MLPTRKSLTELAAAQLDRRIFAFTLGSQPRQITRLRAIHARRVSEVEAVLDLIADTTPDLILRTADGRELVLRLDSDEMRCLCCTLHEKLTNGVREVEEQIVEELLEAERHRNEPDPTDPRPAILALCQPATLATNAPVPPSGQ